MHLINSRTDCRPAGACGSSSHDPNPVSNRTSSNVHHTDCGRIYDVIMMLVETGLRQYAESEMRLPRENPPDVDQVMLPGRKTQDGVVADLAVDYHMSPTSNHDSPVVAERILTMP